MISRMLVTGGAGFIGSNFITYFMQKYPNVKVVNLDKLTYAGSMDNLSEVIDKPNFNHITGDICDEHLLSDIFAMYEIDCVVHFAAESHVDNSVTGPAAFVQTNVVGTFTLLQSALHAWMNGPQQVKPGKEHCRFHHISTDEVYGALGSSGSFSESTAYAPNSPYSATKASSDFLVRAYHRTYGLNVTTSNCSNNYGPRQHIEKLIPKTIRCILNNEPIPVYGSGTNIRDWLYVIDHCCAIDTIIRCGKSGETYNVGTDNELDNMTLIKAICELMDKKVPSPNGKPYASLIEHVADRPGHDFRYSVNASKLKAQTHWQPQYHFNEALEQTVDWYIAKLRR